MQIELVVNEFVWVLCPQIVFRKGTFGKVLEIDGDDCIASASDGRSYHVSIVRVGQLDRFDQILVAFDEALRNCSVHELFGAFKLLPAQVRSLSKEGANPFFLNAIGPSGAKQPGRRKFDKDVPQRRRI